MFGPQRQPSAFSSKVWPGTSGCLSKGMWPFVASGCGRQQIMNCITTEVWDLPPGQWALRPHEGGAMQVYDAESPRSKFAHDIFLWEVVAKDGTLFVQEGRGGPVHPLARFLKDFVVKYDTIHWDRGASMSIKIYELKRPARGCSIFWELTDLALSLGCGAKKGQSCRKWLSNVWAKWAAELELLAAPSGHLRKRAPHCARCRRLLGG